MEEKQYKGYLTATLLNCFTSKFDIMPLLRRDDQEQSEWILKGIEFENNIMSGQIEELQDLITGGLYQQCLYKECNGYLLFGYADLIKKFTIYDFKFVKNYEIGKYREAVQHLLYMYCADMDNFKYIIGTKDGSIYEEEYKRNDLELFKIVNQFDFWLDKTNNRQLYEQNYNIERIKEHVNFI